VKNRIVSAGTRAVEAAELDADNVAGRDNSFVAENRGGQTLSFVIHLARWVWH